MSWGAITTNPTRALRHLEFIGLCFFHTRLVFAQKPEHQAGKPPQILPLHSKDTVRSNVPQSALQGPRRALLPNAYPAPQGKEETEGYKTRCPVQSCSGNYLSFTVPHPYSS